MTITTVYTKNLTDPIVCGAVLFLGTVFNAITNRRNPGSAERASHRGAA